MLSKLVGLGLLALVATQVNTRTVNFGVYQYAPPLPSHGDSDIPEAAIYKLSLEYKSRSVSFNFQS